jgi:hypothetical protein
MSENKLREGTTYEGVVDMDSDRLPTVCRGGDRVFWKNTMFREGATLLFTYGKDYDGPIPEWFVPQREYVGERPSLLGDDIENDMTDFSQHPDHVEPETRGDQPEQAFARAASIIDHSNDEHWTSTGKPRVEFFSEQIGRTVTRAELSAALPELLRQES